MCLSSPNHKSRNGSKCLKWGGKGSEGGVIQRLGIYLQVTGELTQEGKVPLPLAGGMGAVRLDLRSWVLGNLEAQPLQPVGASKRPVGRTSEGRGTSTSPFFYPLIFQWCLLWATPGHSQFPRESLKHPAAPGGPGLLLELGVGWGGCRGDTQASGAGQEGEADAAKSIPLMATAKAKCPGP